MTAPEAGQRPFFGFTQSRPVAITMVALAVCFFGLLGLWRLPQNLLPDISYPALTVRTEFAGASPQDVEERVSEKVQELVAVVPGVRRLYSVSRPGVSDVVLEFAWDTEMVFAVADVRERLDRFFPPAGAGRPLVLRYDPSLDPVLTLGLYPVGAGDGDLVALRRYADLELDDTLAQIEGVAAVELRGGDAEEIAVSIDEQALAAKGLDIATVSARLAAENMNAAAGAIEEGRTEFLVRARNEYRDLREIENTIVDSRGDARIRLGEIARVQRRPADPVVISRIGGRPAVLIDIHKAADANVVDLCARVRERVFGSAAQQAAIAAGRHLQEPPAEVAADPGRRLEWLQRRRAMGDFLAFDLRQQGMQIEPLLDQSTFIEDAIDEVLHSAVVGGGLAIAVIFLFLRSLFATAVLAVSIPLSLLATFAPMSLSGIDLNIMSLGGLALGVGMLVDNSIVVLESIAKQREAGLDRGAAAVAGVSKVAGAVIASTLTTVAVFFPIVFVEGMAGQLFEDQALTVVYALLMSLLVALFVVPMLASRGTVPAAGPAPAPGRVARGLGWLLRGPLQLLRLLLALLLLPLRALAAVFARGYALVDRGYPRLLRGSLRHRWLLAAVVLGLAGLAVELAGRLGQRVLPEVHQGEFWLHAFLPRQATVKATDATMRELEAKVAALPAVASTFVASGVDPEKLESSESGKHSARLLVRLRPAADQAAQELAAQAAIDAMLRQEPRVQSHRFSSTSVLQFDAGIVVEVLGHDLAALRQASDRIAAALRQLPALAEVRTTLQRGNPELTVEFDRDRLAALGLDAERTARLLRAKVQGEVPTLFAERERKIDLRVRSDREQLASQRDLAAVNVNPDGYPEVPLAAVARIDRREGPSEIRRFGNVRGAEVQAKVRGFDLAGAQRQVEGALAELRLPRGIEARLGGQKEELERSNRSLSLAMWMAVFLVYLVMAAQFENMLQPLIILLSVPLALIGVVLALWLFDVELSVIVFLGAIVLAGIVVNNAIILIDQINQLRQQGVPLLAAVVDGAHGRLRPVLMTTLTTLLGLLPQTGVFGSLPLLGGDPAGIELRAPMAVTVIAGLSCSTLLTLLVVPVIYASVARRRA